MHNKHHFKNLENKLTKELVKSIIQSLYATEVLSDEDLKDNKSLANAFKNIFKDGDISVIIDHRGGILEQAKKYQKLGSYEFSRIFYATYFEHSINSIIENYCSRRKISLNSQTEIIKNVNLWGKLTWMLEILNLPKFNKVHLKTIKILADNRNAFIHYKWKPSDEFDKNFDREIENKIILSEFEQIQKAVIYFKKYEAKVMFNGKKKILQKLKMFYETKNS